MAAAEEGPGPEIGCTGARFGVASRRRRVAPQPAPRDPITEVIPALPDHPAPAESGRDPDDVPDEPAIGRTGPGSAGRCADAVRPIGKWRPARVRRAGS